MNVEIGPNIEEEKHVNVRNNEILDISAHACVLLGRIIDVHAIGYIYKLCRN